MNGNQNNFYLCEFCGEIKQVQTLPKTFQLFIEVVSNIFQIIQTYAINKQLEAEDNAKNSVNSKDLSKAKTINPIETKTIEEKK